MSRFRLLLALAAVGLLNCHQSIFTAPPGSTITLIANPDFISAHGGVSIITAIVIEPTGSPVADGTVVQFFTSLGRIEEQGRTNDGVARVNLISDSRSGTARVTAFSGGGSVSSNQPTPSATPSGTPTAPPTGGGGATTGSIDVTIGNILPRSVIVNAVPQRIASPARSTHVIATVLDARGNPVPNVPVYFSLIAPSGVTAPSGTRSPINERLDSSGNPIFTDNNGRAEDIVRTVAVDDGDIYNIAVFATVIGGDGALVTGQTVVFVN